MSATETFLGIPAQDFDRVARGYRAFLLDQEVETAAPACEEQLGHIVTPELHAQFVAGQARLRNLQNRGSYLQPVADKKRVLAESFDSQVFTEGAVRKFEFGMFGFPHRIVLDRIDIHSFVSAAVHAEISLAVAIKVQPP